MNRIDITFSIESRKMKTTLDYLNAVKAKTGAVSDYALAKELGITRATVSAYMRKGGSFSDKTAVKVAKILDIELSEVLLAAHIERTQNETVKSAYKSIFERLGGVAASVLVASALFSTPAPVKAESAVTSENLYIMLNDILTSIYLNSMICNTTSTVEQLDRYGADICKPYEAL
jgi:transcriptional regulator with XRE-family HTH domain